MKNINSRKGGCLFTLVKWLLVMLVALGVIYYFFGGCIISTAITQVGKKAEIDMGGDVSLSLWDQEAEIKNFYILNPQPDYSKENAVSFKEVFVRTKITLSALKKQDPIEIDEIRIISPLVRLEKDKDASILMILTKNNIKEIQNRFAALAASDKAQEAAPAPANDGEKPAEQPKEGYKFRINKVVFEDGKIVYSSGGKDSSVKIPSFTIEGIGSQEGGTTASGAIVDIITNFSLQTLAAAKNLALDSSDMLKDFSKDAAEEIQNQTKNVLDAFKALK